MARIVAVETIDKVVTPVQLRLCHELSCSDLVIGVECGSSVASRYRRKFVSV